MEKRNTISDKNMGMKQFYIFGTHTHTHTTESSLFGHIFVKDKCIFTDKFKQGPAIVL